MRKCGHACTRARAHARTRAHMHTRRQRHACARVRAYLLGQRPAAQAPAQLRRFSRESPREFARVARWQTLTSLIQSRWTGARHLPVSFSEASWTGLLDFLALAWDAALARVVGLDPGTLPELADHKDARRGLCEAYRRRWPELAGALLFPAVGDGAAANIGAKCVSQDRVCVTIGTSAAVRIVLPLGEEQKEPLPPKGLWCYRLDKRRVLLGGALTDGGSLFEWLRGLGLGSPSGDADLDLEAELAAMGPDEHGLTVLPFLSGERAPGWQPDARGTICGLTRQTTSAQLMRAGLESVALRLAAIVELLGPWLGPGAVIVGSGEALRASPAWQQILADATGHQVVMERESEATSRGVALLAEQALGGASTPPLEPHVLRRPDAAARAKYAAARARQEDLYRRLYGSVA